MVLDKVSIQAQINSSAMLEGEAMFTPNEENFWHALDRVQISIASSRVTPQEGGEPQAQEQVKELLREHLSKPKRLFDILFFDKSKVGQAQQAIPFFELIPSRNKLKCVDEAKEKENAESQAKAPAQAKERNLMKISDSQEKCIVCLEPTLLYPSTTDRAWVEEALERNEEGKTCTSIRNRKTLGNYKNTGFCHNHVYGTEGASEQAYQSRQFKTVRGFNLDRRTGECKIRHMLCIDTGRGKGKVFLKWCTQCHLWKNFNEFYREENINTFCECCQERQKQSRSKQLLKRRNSKGKQLPNGDKGEKPTGTVTPQAITYPVGAPIPDDQHNSNGASLEAVAMELLQTAVPQPQVVPVTVSAVPVPVTYNGNGNGNGTAAAGAVSAGVPALDPPKTPEIQEQQMQEKENGATPIQDFRNLPKEAHNANAIRARQHRSAVIRKKRTEEEMSMDGPVDMAMELLEPSQPLNGHKKKKNKRKTNLNPKETERLQKLQLELLQKIPLIDFPFWHCNESDFLEALDSVTVDKKSLREYYVRPDRQGDILFFSRGNIPAFVQESNPIPKRGVLMQLMASDASKGIKYFPNMRISDQQKLCINSLKPVMIFPSTAEDQLLHPGKKWTIIEPKTQVCDNVRNTSDCKKKLENYKFTGFCVSCVRGEGMASQDMWGQTGFASIRGFNLGRKKVDHRLRHLVCLEDPNENKVFLKWCTQCHTWKNFSSFLKRKQNMATGALDGSIDKLNTFCAVCNRRQVVSRKMQSESRVVTQRTLSGANNNFQPQPSKVFLPPGKTITFSPMITEVTDKSNGTPMQDPK